MNKLKKIGMILVLGIMMVLGSVTTSQAGYNYQVGQKVPISYKDYVNNDDIFCVQEGQKLTGTETYTVISKVDIKGRKSTDHKGNTVDSWYNAKYGYILSKENGSDKKETGDLQIAIWHTTPEWITNVGKKHGLYEGFASATDFYLPVKLETEATAYANNMKEEIKFKDNTKKDKIKVVPETVNGQEYMKVGPFNWTFPGKLTEIVLYDQNGNTIKYKEGFKSSGKDFYLYVPADMGITKITKIEGKAEYDVKGATAWFLKSSKGDFQNLMIKEPSNGKDEITGKFDYDIPVQGNLKVVKVNEDNKEIKLEGVGFIIQNKNTGKYVHQDGNGNITYVNKDQATEFITDKNGEILIKNLMVGTYVAYETKNPNYGYEIITDGKEKTIVVNKDNVLTIGNKQKYIKLSGYVWLDKIFGKNSERNDLFKDNDYDEFDILLDGITVRLKDRTTGETIKETKTADGGAYLFEDVLIEKLGDYYIEFEYDGLTYTNVIPHIDRDNGSKAAENSKVRDEFNRKFSKVEGTGELDKGITRGADNEKVYDLSYNIDKNEHKAYLINNGQYIITANTDETSFNIKEQFTPGQEEIKYINLGLYEREQTDTALIKDLENVRVSINGYEHTYLYAQRFNHPDEFDGDGFNVGVKFGNKYGTKPYTRAIYESDYTYENPEDRSKELKVQVTYNIAVRNETTSLITQINSLVDYYDSRYKLVAVGTELDEKGNIKESNIEFTDEGYNDKYNKTVIYNNTKLNPQTQSSIYVQFELSREAVKLILESQGAEETVGKDLLENVVEVNAYSTFDMNGNVYAGVDKDSNPGNAVPGDKTTYQDDTDSSPALKLEVAGARELAGKVFVDSTTGELQTGKVRQGSGAYEDGELGVEGVDITLTENSGTNLVYKDVKTDANGDFLITGFIPGDYTLTYTWGNDTYTVQNYKGTIYQSSRDQGDKEWYKKEVDKRLTDAIDNYNQDQDAPKGSRLQIDEELKNIDKDINSKITRKQMDSTTPIMGIGVEYDNLTTDSAGDRYTYRINNVDFGIVERARQDLALNKRVKTMKATLANGQPIVDFEIKEDGTLVGETNHIQYIPASGNDNGKVMLTIDTELIQGAIVEVGYEIKATNNSELDYLSEDFYKYGKVGGAVVTITPSAVVDYLDKDWAFDSSKNPDWAKKELSEIQGLVIETVYNNLDQADNEKIILYTESLKQPLEPTKANSVMLNVSKVLSSTDEIELDNETEIVKLEKTGGSKTVSTPGNYVPGTGKTETDDSTAETVIVTPPFGSGMSVMTIITISIAVLAIAGVGIVVIKKKALGNK